MFWIFGMLIFGGQFLNGVNWGTYAVMRLIRYPKKTKETGRAVYGVSWENYTGMHSSVSSAGSLR